MSLNSTSSTNELLNAVGWNYGPLELTPGPVWITWEQFRTGGPTGLDTIPKHGVATLRTKKGTFRVMRDDDFQHLLGIASSIHRLQKGVRVIVQTAKLAFKHPDREHMRLLLESASMLAESPILPEREGHDSFRLTTGETSEQSAEDLDFEITDIPRPKW